jgi:hypothetical protein
MSLGKIGLADPCLAERDTLSIWQVLVWEKQPTLAATITCIDQSCCTLAQGLGGVG